MKAFLIHLIFVAMHSWLLPGGTIAHNCIRANEVQQFTGIISFVSIFSLLRLFHVISMVFSQWVGFFCSIFYWLTSSILSLGNISLLLPRLFCGQIETWKQFNMIRNGKFIETFHLPWFAVFRQQQWVCLCVVFSIWFASLIHVFTCIMF